MTDQGSKEMSMLDRAKAICGHGPGGKLNYAYGDGYAWVAFKRRYGMTPREALEKEKVND